MPIHDWTRVRAGIFHHFHQKWIGTIAHALNGGLLLRKSAAALRHGVHLALLDLLPPGPFDPPPDRPLTPASYRAAGDLTAYVEPAAVGLEPADVPLRWRRVIEGEA